MTVENGKLFQLRQLYWRNMDFIGDQLAGTGKLHLGRNQILLKAIRPASSTLELVVQKGERSTPVFAVVDVYSDDCPIKPGMHCCHVASGANPIRPPTAKEFEYAAVDVRDVVMAWWPDDLEPEDVSNA